MGRVLCLAAGIVSITHIFLALSTAYCWQKKKNTQAQLVASSYKSFDVP